jgi:hypothetical protein
MWLYRYFLTDPDEKRTERPDSILGRLVEDGRTRL